MHKITKAFWDRGLTLRKWALLNDFSPRYVAIVISGKRGAWGVGVAQKIKYALISQGFARKEDFNKEG